MAGRARESPTPLAWKSKQCAREQGLFERRELAQPPVDAREILERASGEPYPLDAVVAQTRESERLPGASSDELARNGRKHPP